MRVVKCYTNSFSIIHGIVHWFLLFKINKINIQITILDWQVTNIIIRIRFLLVVWPTLNRRDTILRKQTLTTQADAIIFTICIRTSGLYNTRAPGEHTQIYNWCVFVWRTHTQIHTRVMRSSQHIYANAPGGCERSRFICACVCVVLAHRKKNTFYWRKSALEHAGTTNERFPIHVHTPTTPNLWTWLHMTHLPILYLHVCRGYMEHVMARRDTHRRIVLTWISGVIRVWAE